MRASGLPYTIVRPGGFDYNARDQHQLVFLQGDTRHDRDPSDGVVARHQIGAETRQATSHKEIMMKEVGVVVVGAGLASSASTCRLISVPTFGRLRVRKCV